MKTVHLASALHEAEKYIKSLISHQVNLSISCRINPPVPVGGPTPTEISLTLQWDDPEAKVFNPSVTVNGFDIDKMLFIALADYNQYWVSKLSKSKTKSKRLLVTEMAKKNRSRK